MNQIQTKRTTNRPPAMQTPAMFDLVKTFSNRIEVEGTTKKGDRCLISSLCAPTVDQRRTLEGRRNELVDALAPRGGDTERVADAILEMFYCWDAGRRMEAVKAAKTAAKYAEQVQDLPAWAVKAACDYWSKADSPFPPSAGEVRAQALRLISASTAEAAELNRILTAEVYMPNSDEERDRVKKGFSELLSGVAKTNGTKPRDEKRPDYRDIGQRGNPAPMPPVAEAAAPMPKLSPETLKRFAESR